MAIPGYTQNVEVDLSEIEYYDYVANMVGIMGNTHAEVLAKIKAIREDVTTYANFNILDSDGNVDLWKIRTPTLDEIKNMKIKVVFWDASTEPVASGFVNGTFCIFYGAAADAYIKEWSLPTPQALVAPTLYVSSVQNAGLGVSSSNRITTYVFAATFMTRWGETGPSNAAYIHVEDDPYGIEKWSAVLEVEADKIPSYALSVRYYRFFDVFRLIGEVKI